MGGGSNVNVHVRRGEDKTTVTIAGLVDELADFSDLTSLEGLVQLDLRGIRRFNSAGVRVWVDAMRSLTSNATVSFVECSPSVVDQLNMITGFLGKGRVVSFVGPMMCPICDATEDVVFEAKMVRDLEGLPETRCPSCGGIMELDDDPESYLLFVREPTAVGG